MEARDVFFQKSGTRDPRIVGEGHNKDFGTGEIQRPGEL